MRQSAVVVVTVVTVVAFVGAITGSMGCEILATNPLDPATDPEFQERATLRGTVRGVVAPDVDGSVPAAGVCADGADVAAGDNEGFVVVLRGLSDGGDGIVGQSKETNASGGFEFTFVPAGDYVVEVARDGFDVPDATSLALSFGEERTLPTLCAVKNSAPPSPVVSAPPTLVNVDNVAPGAQAAAGVNIAADDSGVVYRLRESTDGAVVRDEEVDAGFVALVLDATPGVADDDVRRTWRVDVVAVDALGNTSAPVSFPLDKDGLAPAPPALSLTAARDRVQVALAPGAVVDGDDGSASFVVAYAVVAPVSFEGGCEFGKPGVDDRVVHGAFAVEGRSPIDVAAASLTLSGLQPGTDLFVLAAAKDGAGNTSCWSAPQAVRPDVVTFVVDAARAIDPVGNARRVAARDGAFAFARGDAGAVVFDRSGASHVVDAIAHDVAIVGDSLLCASGVLGVTVVDLDGDGAPGASRTIALGGKDAHAFAVRAGHVFVGGDNGVVDLDNDGTFVNRALDGDADGRVIALASFGRLLVVARDGNEKVIEVQRIGDATSTPRRVGRVTLPTAANALVIVDGRAWVGQGDNGVAVVDVSACGTVNADCARLVARRRLPGSVLSLAVFDDAVLIGDDAGDVTVGEFDDGSVDLIGKVSVGAHVDGVAAVEGGFCAGVADDAGSRFACATTVSAPLIDEERRLATATEGVVTRVAPAAGQGAHVRQLLGGGAEASLFGFDDGGVISTVAVDNDLVVTAVEGTGFIAGDALLRHDGSTGVVDISGALADNGLVAPYRGFGVVVGDRLVFGVVAEGGAAVEAAIVSADIAEDASGLALDNVVVSDLGAVAQVLTAVERRGRVYFGTQPFGVFSIGAEEGDVVVEQALEAGGSASDIGFIVDDAGVDRAFIAGSLADVGDRIFVVSADGVLDRNGAVEFDEGSVKGMTVFGDQLVVSTVDDGAVFVDVAGGALRPVLQVPSVSQVGQTLPTSRGLLCADGPGGTAWLIVR